MSLITVCECVTMTITKFDNDKNAALPSCLPDLAPSDFPFKSHLKAYRRDLVNGMAKQHLHRCPNLSTVIHQRRVFQFKIQGLVYKLFSILKYYVLRVELLCVVIAMHGLDNDRDFAWLSYLPDLAPNDFPLQFYTTRSGEQDGHATSSPLCRIHVLLQHSSTE